LRSSGLGSSESLPRDPFSANALRSENRSLLSATLQCSPPSSNQLVGGGLDVIAAGDTARVVAIFLSASCLSPTGTRLRAAALDRRGQWPMTLRPAERE
jgi:hypothetical protein